MTAEAQPPCCTGLTAQQVQVLLSELPEQRVSADAKGHAALEHWDVRRTLIRVFGFTGYDIEDDDPVLLKEVNIPPDNPQGRHRWTVAYRAKTRLTVKCVHGRPIAHWDGTAAESAQKQPDLAAAHDQAMKSAASQALKRAAMNLGDQFGLCLYNGGGIKPVVLSSAAYWGEAPDVTEIKDDPVQPEPDSTDEGSQEVPEQPAPAQQERPAGQRPQWRSPQPCAGAQDFERWFRDMNAAYRTAPSVAAIKALQALVKKARTDGLLSDEMRAHFLTVDATRAAEIADLDRHAQQRRSA